MVTCTRCGASAFGVDAGRPLCVACARKVADGRRPFVVDGSIAAAKWNASAFAWLGEYALDPLPREVRP